MTQVGLAPHAPQLLVLLGDPRRHAARRVLGEVDVTAASVLREPGVELLAVLGVVDGDVERGAGGADGLCCEEHDAFVHDGVPVRPRRLADAFGGGTVQGDRVLGGGVDRLVLFECDAGGVPRDEVEADLGVAVAGEDEEGVGGGGVVSLTANKWRVFVVGLA